MGGAAAEAAKNQQFKWLSFNLAHEPNNPFGLLAAALLKLLNQFNIGHQNSPATRP
jgi:hypothetical protein